MATIVNQQPPERVALVERTDNSGWGVAVLILVIVIAVGAYAYFHYHRAAQPTSGGTNINVTLPGGTTNDGSTDTTGY